MTEDPWQSALSVLQLSTRLVDGIQAGLRERGFEHIRAVHGFAFVRIAQGGATTRDVAAHLGVSKQAGAQLIARLVEWGYVTRAAHPEDARARILQLTERGDACTRAAAQSAAETVRGWRQELGPHVAAPFEATLRELTADAGPVRPSW